MKKLIILTIAAVLFFGFFCFPTVYATTSNSSAESSSAVSVNADTSTDQDEADLSPESIDASEEAPTEPITAKKKLAVEGILLWVFVSISSAFSIAGFVLYIICIKKAFDSIKKIEKTYVPKEHMDSFASMENVEKYIDAKLKLLSTKGSEPRNTRVIGEKPIMQREPLDHRNTRPSDFIDEERRKTEIAEEKRRCEEEERQRIEEEQQQKIEEERQKKARIIRDINDITSKDRIRWRHAIGDMYPNVKFVNRAMNGIYTIAAEPNDSTNELFAVISPDRNTLYLVPFASDCGKCGDFYKMPSSSDRLWIEELAEISIDNSNHVTVKKPGLLTDNIV